VDFVDLVGLAGVRCAAPDEPLRARVRHRARERERERERWPVLAQAAV
jgi:hypothetical protein